MQLDTPFHWQVVLDTKRNLAITDIIQYTCASHAATSQNVWCEKGLYWMLANVGPFADVPITWGNKGPLGQGTDHVWEMWQVSRFPFNISLSLIPIIERLMSNWLWTYALCIHLVPAVVRAETLEYNRGSVSVFSNTCTTPTITAQNVVCVKGLLIHKTEPQRYQIQQRLDQSPCVHNSTRRAGVQDYHHLANEGGKLREAIIKHSAMGERRAERKELHRVDKKGDQQPKKRGKKSQKWKKN